MTTTIARFGNASASVGRSTVVHMAAGRDATWAIEQVWAVTVTLPYGSDDMIESVEHSVRFTSRARAERLAAKVRASRVPLNTKEWIWAASKASAYSFMHDAPTALRRVLRGA